MPAREAQAVFYGPRDTIVHTTDAVLVNGRVLPLSSTPTRDSRHLPVPVAEYGALVLG